MHDPAALEYQDDTITAKRREIENEISRCGAISEHDKDARAVRPSALACSWHELTGARVRARGPGSAVASRRGGPVVAPAWRGRKDERAWGARAREELAANGMGH